MSKVLFYFNGTDLYNSPHENNFKFPADIVRVYFKGANGGKTGGGRLLPNLADVAERLANTFNNDKIDLDKLRKDFGEDVIIKLDTLKNKKRIEGIKEVFLTGYSRGAISAFYTAKELHRRNNKLPVRIMANQPVPGNFHDEESTVAGILNLQHCDNIKSVDIVVGRYVKKLGFSGANVLKTAIHNFFFTQAIPVFSPTTDATIIEAPIQSHFSTHGNFLANAYMANALSKRILELKGTWFDIKDIYKKSNISELIFLHDEHEAQIVFGNAESIKLDPLYQEVLDELAKEALKANKIAEKCFANLTNEQKKAIYSVHRRMPPTGDTALLMREIINNTSNGIKLTQIINKSTQMIAKCLHYLSEKREGESPKRDHIAQNKDSYLQSLFELSFNFLLLPNRSKQDKEDFMRALSKNDKILINDTICKRENPILDACVTVIKNLVFGTLTLGGVFIYNAINNKNIFFRKEIETQSQLEERTREYRQLLN